MKIMHLDQCEPQGLSHGVDIIKRILFNETELPGSVRLSHAVFKPGQKYAAHSHDDLHEIFYVLAGEGLFRIDGRDYPVKTGSSICIDPHETHEVINNGRDNLIMLYFGLHSDPA